LYRAKPLQTVAAFFLIYVARLACHCPRNYLTLAAGPFSLLWGTVIVSFASSIGADAGIPRLALPPSRHRSGEVRRKAKASMAGVTGRPVLSFHLAAGSAFPFFVINW